MKKYKKKKRWVQATLNNVKKGDRVRMADPESLWSQGPIPIYPLDTGTVLATRKGSQSENIIYVSLDKDTDNTRPEGFIWLHYRLQVLK